MSQSSHHNLPCSYPNASEIIDNVKNKIERCIREYMNFEETVTFLQEKHKINRHLTKIIWEQLQRECPEFFKNYHLKLELMRHMNMFNRLLAKQAAMMICRGDVDISTEQPAITKFLAQDPEGGRVLDLLANKRGVSLSSLPLTESNGPTVNQLQNPNDQQNQVHHYQYSTTSNGFTDNLGAPTFAPSLTDQMFTYNYPAASTVAPTTTAQWSSTNNHAYIGAPTVAQAATTPQDPSTLGFRGNNGFNSLNLEALELEQLALQPGNQLNEQYLPQLQNFSQQEQPRLQYGVSNNGIQNGGNNNIGVMQSENQLQGLYGQYQPPQLQMQQPFLLEEPSRLQYGVNNSELQYGGNNNIRVMQSENQLQDFNGQYQPQLKLQQSFLIEELPRLQYEVNNSELQYGGNNNWMRNGENNNGMLGVIPESCGFQQSK